MNYTVKFSIPQSFVHGERVHINPAVTGKVLSTYGFYPWERFVSLSVRGRIVNVPELSLWFANL